MDKTDRYIAAWKVKAMKFVVLVLMASLGVNGFLFLRCAHLERLKNEWRTNASMAYGELITLACEYTAEKHRNDELAEAFSLQARCLLTTLVKLNVRAEIPFTPDEIHYIRTNEPNPVPFPETERGGAIGE